jgi:hypothetical protein
MLRTFFYDCATARVEGSETPYIHAETLARSGYVHHPSDLSLSPHSPCIWLLCLSSIVGSLANLRRVIEIPKTETVHSPALKNKIKDSITLMQTLSESSPILRRMSLIIGSFNCDLIFDHRRKDSIPDQVFFCQTETPDPTNRQPECLQV